MKDFESYFYNLTLEFKSLSNDDDIKKFYVSKIDEAKDYIKKNSDIDNFKLHYTKCTNGIYGYQPYLHFNNGKLLTSKTAYESKSSALMKILYNIHIGEF